MMKLRTSELMEGEGRNDCCLFVAIFLFVSTLLIIACVFEYPSSWVSSDTTNTVWQKSENAHHNLSSSLVSVRHYFAGGAQFALNTLFGYYPVGVEPLNPKLAARYRRFTDIGLSMYFTEKAFCKSSLLTCCNTCKLLVTAVRLAAKINKTRDYIEQYIYFGCVKIANENQDVCNGLISLFSDEFFTVLDNLFLSPEEVCGLVFGPTCSTFYWPLLHWNVTFPSSVKPPVRPHVLPTVIACYAHLYTNIKPGSPTARVLHLTDIHLDLKYLIGTNSECGKPLCCQSDDGPAKPGRKGAGRYGDYHNCDMPLGTLIDMLSHLSNETIDYILWTGDLPAHDIWNQSQEGQVSILFRLSDIFQKYFPGIPVFPAVGNHDTLPVDSFPPRSIGTGDSIQWLYDALAKSWSRWLPEDCLNTVRKYGYYTVSPSSGYRIVSINSNSCNNMNWWLYLNATDPDGQLAWLIRVLQNAEDNKEKVHIIGHIPPGISDCLYVWSYNYYKIITRYESTVVGQFFGHTHFDQFQVFYGAATPSRATNVAYISPSVTPYSQLNVGYRMFVIDGNYTGCSWEVLDHETYILNLSEANAMHPFSSHASSRRWMREYTAKEDYNMASLFPEDWSNLIGRMKSNNTLLQMYYKHYYKSHLDASCDDFCKRRLLCSAMSSRLLPPSPSTYCKLSPTPSFDSSIQ